MKATVIGLDRMLKTVAVELEPEDIAVFAMETSQEIEIGDRIFGDFGSSGCSVIINATRQKRISITIRGVHCSRGTARALLLAG